MATTPRKTVLEISDEILALPRDTMLTSTGIVMVYPAEGGRLVLPAGSRLRISRSSPRDDYATVLTEAGKVVRLEREHMGNLAVLRKFKVRVSQMVEQIGTVMIEASTPEEAHLLASEMDDITNEINPFSVEEGKGRGKARIFEVSEGDVVVLER